MAHFYPIHFGPQCGFVGFVCFVFGAYQPSILNQGAEPLMLILGTGQTDTELLPPLQA